MQEKDTRDERELPIITEQPTVIVVRTYFLLLRRG